MNISIFLPTSHIFDNLFGFEDIKRTLQWIIFPIFVFLPFILPILNMFSKWIFKFIISMLLIFNSLVSISKQKSIARKLEYIFFIKKLAAFKNWERRVDDLRDKRYAKYITNNFFWFLYTLPTNIQIHNSMYSNSRWHDSSRWVTGVISTRWVHSMQATAAGVGYYNLSRCRWIHVHVPTSTLIRTMSSNY